MFHMNLESIVIGTYKLLQLLEDFLKYHVSKTVMILILLPSNHKKVKFDGI